ncbi:hypothetical protein D3C84_997440 [compost metagenome]
MIAKRWRINAHGTSTAFQIQLALAGKAMTNLLPMNKITAMEDRDAREIFK